MFFHTSSQPVVRVHFGVRENNIDNGREQNERKTKLQSFDLQKETCAVFICFDLAFGCCYKKLKQIVED